MHVVPGHQYTAWSLTPLQGRQEYSYPYVAQQKGKIFSTCKTWTGGSVGAGIRLILFSKCATFGFSPTHSSESSHITDSLDRPNCCVVGIYCLIDSRVIGSLIRISFKLYTRPVVLTTRHNAPSHHHVDSKESSIIIRSAFHRTFGTDLSLHFSSNRPPFVLGEEFIADSNPECLLSTSSPKGQPHLS